MNLDTVIERRLAAALAPASEVLDAYLFGSHARGDAKPHSDVDVAVYVLEEAADSFDVAAITTALVEALQINAVDVVVLNRASPLLYHRVLRDGVRVLSRDSQGTAVREGRALSRYCDYVPQLAKIDRAHAARIASGSFGR